MPAGLAANVLEREGEIITEYWVGEHLWVGVLERLDCQVRAVARANGMPQIIAETSTKECRE